MITNAQLFQLVNTGVLSTSSHTLPPEDSYKLLKFKRAVRSALDRVRSLEMELPKEVGIEDASAFDKEHARLLLLKERTEEESNTLKEFDEKLDRLNKLREKFYAEKCPLEGTKTMSYESYHKLASENKDTTVSSLSEGKPVTYSYDVFTINEDILEDILWVAPTN